MLPEVVNMLVQWHGYKKGAMRGVNASGADVGLQHLASKLQGNQRRI